ncbi:MAG: hypothetical protein WHS38_04390 [Thermodesulforhabdaceae bacterium]
MNVDDQEKTICFCFNHKVKDIINDVLINQGQSKILEQIMASKKAGGCKCHDIHPQKR